MRAHTFVLRACDEGDDGELNGGRRVLMVVYIYVCIVMRGDSTRARVMSEIEIAKNAKWKVNENSRIQYV